MPHRLPHASQMPGGPKCHGASAGRLRWPMHHSTHANVAQHAKTMQWRGSYPIQAGAWPLAANGLGCCAPMPRAASSPAGPNPRPCALRLQKPKPRRVPRAVFDQRRKDQRRQGHCPASSTPAVMRAHSALPSHRRSVIDRQLAPNIAWLGRPARANPHPFALPAVACAAASGFPLARQPYPPCA